MSNEDHTSKPIPAFIEVVNEAGELVVVSIEEAFENISQFEEALERTKAEYHAAIDRYNALVEFSQKMQKQE